MLDRAKLKNPKQNKYRPPERLRIESLVPYLNKIPKGSYSELILSDGFEKVEEFATLTQSPDQLSSRGCRFWISIAAAKNKLQIVRTKVAKL